MPRTADGWSISTLQDFLENDDQLTLFCRCGHHLTMSLPKLIERLGGDFDVVKRRDEFLNKFVCNECGQRPFTVQLTPKNTPGM